MLFEDVARRFCRFYLFFVGFITLAFSIINYTLFSSFSSEPAFVASPLQGVTKS